MSLYTKLALIRDEIGVIAKEGRNDHHHYDYVRAEDVTKRARELFTEHKLLLVPNCIGHRREGTLTVTHMQIKIVDLESEQTEIVDWHGEGADKQDKGVYKAYTGGMKYFLMNLLMIPSTEDPEASNGAGNGNGASTSSQNGAAKPAKANGNAAHCPECGCEMWDNREDKRNPKSPDYKCKDKECGNAIWVDALQRQITERIGQVRALGTQNDANLVHATSTAESGDLDLMMKVNEWLDEALEVNQDTPAGAAA